MICKKCGADQPDSHKFCRMCGSLLQGKSCPACGNPMAETDKFCAKCGARCDGKKVCPACGTIGEGAFCAKCGTALGGSRPVAPQPPPTYRPVSSVRSANPDQKKRIAAAVKNGLVTVFSLIIFVCSFFGAFNLRLYANTFEEGGIEFSVSSTDLVGAMFRLGRMGSSSHNYFEFQRYVQKNASAPLIAFLHSDKGIDKMPSSLRREYSRLMSRGGYIGVILGDDRIQESPSLLIRGIFWGMLSLSVILLAFAALLLSALALIFGLAGRPYLFKSRWAIFILLFGLPVLLFLLVSGTEVGPWPGSGAWAAFGGGLAAVVALSLLSLAAEGVYRYVFDRPDSVSARGLISAGVSFVTAAVLLCCLGLPMASTRFKTGPTNDGHTTVNVTVTAPCNLNDLLSAVDLPRGKVIVGPTTSNTALIRDVYLEDYMQMVNGLLKKTPTSADRELILSAFVTPVMMYGFKNYRESLPAGVAINAAVYAAVLLLAVSLMLMMIRSASTLLSGGNKTRAFEWLAAGAALVVLLLMIANVLSLGVILGLSYPGDFGLRVSVAIGPMAIVPFALTVANLVQKKVLSRRKKTAAPQSSPAPDKTIG